MDFELTEAQTRWRDEVRGFLVEHVTDALIEELLLDGPHGSGPAIAAFRRAVGAMGWYGLNWPPEYGGLGRSAIEQQILITEFDYAGVPGPDLTVTSVAPMIMRHGTERNKTDFLPGIASGEITVAVGYSEPDAGTDLAALTTSARLDGEEWVINGTKIWNSHAHHATHEWLCVRTDPDAPRHRGLSVIMVPMATPGIEVSPLITWRDFQTDQTFFTDVRVPRENLIGRVNEGWTYITGALDRERGALASPGDLRSALDTLLELCGATGADGTRPLDDPDARRRLAELDSDVEVARLFALDSASRIDADAVLGTAMTVEKIHSSELRQKIADYGTQVLGPAGQLDWRDPGAPARGAFERLYRQAPLRRFGGGTNEVLRDIIAQRGYGMPSYGRGRG